ncbi:hypothetical protein ACHAQH_005660 [Verticillium albo-atrum]
MSPGLHLAFAATTLISLISPTSAQRNITYDNCPLPIRHVANDRVWNATGSIPISPLNGNEDWYVSTTLTDLRNTNVYYDGWPTGQDLGIFLSVPSDFVSSETANATRICGYTMRGQNATSEGDGSGKDSCRGVLSDECVEEALKTPMPPDDGPCPELDVGDKCDVSTRYRTFCIWDNLPHVDIPSGHRSFAGFPGGHIMPPDAEETEFDVYDLRVRQTVPMLFTVRSGSQEKAHMVCVAPSNVVEGSREPEAEFPPSGAPGLRGAGGVAAAVAVMAAAMLA